MESELRLELEGYMLADKYQFGEIFALYKEGVTDAKEIIARTSAANAGVVSNNRAHIRALLEGQIPVGASVSRQSAWTVGRIMKNNPNMTSALRDYLSHLKLSLEENTNATVAVLHDVEKINRQSDALAKQASRIQHGIYVYSFPTYLHFGTIEDNELYWVKIGSTKNSVWQRIVDQNRQTSMPEDPKLLRIYHKDAMNIEEIEKKFHSTLERIGHERSIARRTRAGTEWFATTLDAIDAIAELMGLQIEKYESGEDAV